MKYLKVYLILPLILLLGCSEEVKRLPKEKEQHYSNEQEKILNEAFLEIVGTDLCFTISAERLTMAQKINDDQGEIAGRKYFDKYKIEDTARVIVFIKDKFISKNDWFKESTGTINLPYTNNSLDTRFADGDSLEADYLPYIKQLLVKNLFIGKEDNAEHILDSLSLPLKISSYNLKQTGCYKILQVRDKENVKGNFKTYGTFNCSRIYIDQVRGIACLFYERNCLEGTKCASGSLVLLKKICEKWKVLKEISIYQT